jgi:hypothetical protein
MGGLGNQMFQYAAAKALSLRRGISFKVDFDCPYRHKKYVYALDAFALKAERASTWDLISRKPKRRVARRLYLLVGKDPNCSLIREKQEFHFDPAFYLIPDGSYVSGFWQSEKYFAEVTDQIRADFVFKEPLTGESHRLQQEMLAQESVSIHLRRGDYVNVEITNKIHGICSPRYYSDAIAYILARISDPTFYVFSDDLDWVRTHFVIPGRMRIVDTGRDHDDLRLMSSCKYQVIANSSFSWWGAWLNSNMNKIVVAPKQWMKDPNIIVRDLLPLNWVRV